MDAKQRLMLHTRSIGRGTTFPFWDCLGAGPPVSPRQAAYHPSGPRHWIVLVVLCCLVAVINSIDRTAMSVAILPMSQHYGWSGKDKGAVSSAFNWGHTVSNLVSGWILLQVAPKTVLSWGVVVWSAFTILTPISAATGWLPALLLVRCCMGLGEGVAFPTMQAIIKNSVPTENRSRALGLVYSGHQIGSTISLLLSPFILNHGVETLFYFYGSLGFLWLAVWQPVAQPGHQSLLLSQHHHDSGPSLATASTEHTSGRVPPKPAHGGPMAIRLRDVPWRDFARTPAVWAIALAHGMFGLTYSICIAWLPTYYSEQFGLNVRESSTMSVLPWLAMALGTNASGWAADMLVNKRVLTLTQARKLLQLLGCGGPALCLAYLALIPQRGFLAEAVGLFTLALGLLGAQAGGFASNHQDIAARYAPFLFGLTNACASLAGSIGVYAVGPILDWTKSWSLVLLIVSACNALSAVTYLAFATSEPLFD